MSEYPYAATTDDSSSVLTLEDRIKLLHLLQPKKPKPLLIITREEWKKIIEQNDFVEGRTVPLSCSDITGMVVEIYNDKIFVKARVIQLMGETPNREVIWIDDKDQQQ